MLREVPSRDDRGRQSAREESISMQALVGFQGHGGADGVQPDFCYPLFLEALLFQWPSK